MRPILVTLFCVILLALTACSVRPEAPSAAPTATLVPTLAPPLPVLRSITDQELLGAANTQTACDAPPEASFSCEAETSTPLLDVEISAATFARWSLHWENALPFTGNETLTLRLTNNGNLTPNLYLVTTDGQRLGVALNNFGLGQGGHTLHVPLAEVRDQEGNTLDYAAVNGVEIVFEWADMQGTLVLESLRVDSVWAERSAVVLWIILIRRVGHAESPTRS